jgi:hypothetical protein
MVSNCATNSARGHYVARLQKHIPVDIYGACGKLTCSRQSDTMCAQLLRNNYRFYLSLENSVCRDYITEKLERAHVNYMVPLVFNNNIYKHILPPHSFIAVDTFASMAALVDHLKYLTNNDTAYMQYHTWRREYEIDRTLDMGRCELCAKLVREQHHVSIREHIPHWYGPDNGVCTPNYGRTVHVF